MYKITVIGYIIYEKCTNEPIKEGVIMTKKFQLDHIDLEILRELREDSKQSIRK